MNYISEESVFESLQSAYQQLINEGYIVPASDIDAVILKETLASLLLKYLN